MFRRIKACGGSIALRAAPHTCKVGVETGKLMLVCRNGSNLSFEVEVINHDTSQISVAKSAFIGGNPPVKKTVNGRAGIIRLILGDKFVVGEWTPVGAGKCYLLVNTTITGTSRRPNSFWPDVMVSVT